MGVPILLLGAQLRKPPVKPLLRNYLKWMPGCVFTSAGVMAYRYLYNLHRNVANTALKVKICCKCLIKKERWGLWRDAKRTALLEKVANRSIETLWWSCLPSAEEAAVGDMVMSTCKEEEEKVLAQWMDREGLLLALLLLWLMPVNIAHSKAEAQMPTPAGRDHACRCYKERRGGGPCGEPTWATAASWDKTSRGPQRVLCKTLPLETLIQFSRLNSHLAKTSVWP